MDDTKHIHPVLVYHYSELRTGAVAAPHFGLRGSQTSPPTSILTKLDDIHHHFLFLQGVLIGKLRMAHDLMFGSISSISTENPALRTK